MAPGPSGPEPLLLSVRHLNLKSIAPLTGLAILAALAGCGGSGDSSTAGVETTAPAGKAETTTKSSPAPQQKASKKNRQRQKPAKSEQKQVEKEIRELANSGKPIPVDSPAVKKILQTLTDNGGSKQEKGKKGVEPIAEALEQVMSPPQNGGGGSGSGGQGSAPSAGVEKILEQIQK